MPVDVHVYPENDLHPHDTTSRYCPCRPKLETANGGCVVVHNSWDGREIIERAIDDLATRVN